MAGQAQYEVFENSRGLAFWRLRSRNGQVVAQSEAYTRREDARRGAGDSCRAALAACDQDPQSPSFTVRIVDV